MRAAAVDRFLRDACRPVGALADLLRLLAGGLAQRVGSPSVRLLLPGMAHVAPDALDVASEAPQPGSTRLVRHRWPIAYGGKSLGELSVGWATPPADGSALLALCEDVASRCGYLAKRYQVRQWAQQRLGCSPLLVGSCAQLHQLEVFVEKAAQSMLPVLIRGEFGTEKALLAVALHACGPDPGRPFIEVNCADPSGQPAQWFGQARGGTLFFNGIDELAPALQSQLPQHMHSRLGQWLAVPQDCETRVVASATADLGQCVQQGLFSRALLAELDFLSVTVPALRERPGDVEALVVAVLERHGFDARRTCTPALIGICHRHAWPENLFEMERVVARLAVMTGGQPIHEADVLRHAPWLVGTPAQALVQAPEAPAANDAREPLQPHRDLYATPQHWVQCVASRDVSELGRLHDALRRALLYLGEHYAEAVSLGQLARQAHVSPSHLGYLFRSGLGTTFKPLLQQLRIEKAKEILGADARSRITEVALRVGFSDLSHFEKSFRRIVGRSPREFRRAMAA